MRESQINGVTLHIYDSVDELAENVANMVIEQLYMPNSRIMVSAGNTFKPVYKKLHKKDFNQAKIFLPDEYVPRDEASFATDIWHDLISHTVNLNSFHFPVNENYGKLIKNNGGIDLYLNAIGIDGHCCGFNFPKTSSSSRFRKIRVRKEIKKENERKYGIKTPNYAWTIGIADALEAKKMIFVATGEDKMKAVYAMLDCRINRKNPATYMRTLGDRCFFAVDKKATGLLERFNLL